MMMNDAYHTPAFNLKAVVQETGLKPDTLRAWERRYNLPQPGRTEGGHRLYSQFDIDLLKWLVARQEEGLSISRAVKLWRQMEAEGQNPLTVMEVHGGSGATAVNPFQGETLTQLRSKWVEACLAFDEVTARQISSQAFATMPVETVCYELLQKGLSEIGTGWYEGKVSVQQEHFASAVAIRQIEALIVTAPDPTRNGRILIACPPDELHTFSSLLMTLFLKRQGWRVIYLGADVPLDQLETAVDTIRPQLTIMNAQTLPAAANLADAAPLLQKNQITFAFGGAAFVHIPALVQKVPGHYLGNTLPLSIQNVPRLLTNPPALPPIPKPSPAYTTVAAQFTQIQREIVNPLLQQGKAIGIPENHLHTAIIHLNKNLHAALRLGDINLLTPEIQWLNGLIIHRSAAYDLTALIPQFLAAYKQVVENAMQADGIIITQWLDRVIASQQEVTE
jgi:DNA-binding transcriptional MerR regulator